MHIYSSSSRNVSIKGFWSKSTLPTWQPKASYGKNNKGGGLNSVGLFYPTRQIHLTLTNDDDDEENHKNVLCAVTMLEFCESNTYKQPIIMKQSNELLFRNPFNEKEHSLKTFWRSCCANIIVIVYATTYYWRSFLSWKILTDDQTLAAFACSGH